MHVAKAHALTQLFHTSCLQIRKDRLTADEVEDLPKEYRFLDTEGDPIVPGKEKYTTLDKCLRRDEKGTSSFWLKPK